MRGVTATILTLLFSSSWSLAQDPPTAALPPTAQAKPPPAVIPEKVATYMAGLSPFLDIMEESIDTSEKLKAGRESYDFKEGAGSESSSLRVPSKFFCSISVSNSANRASYSSSRNCKLTMTTTTTGSTRVIDFTTGRFSKNGKMLSPSFSKKSLTIKGSEVESFSECLSDIGFGQELQTELGQTSEVLTSCFVATVSMCRALANKKVSLSSAKTDVKHAGCFDSRAGLGPQLLDEYNKALESAEKAALQTPTAMEIGLKRAPSLDEVSPELFLKRAATVCTEMAALSRQLQSQGKGASSNDAALPLHEKEK